MSKHPVDGLGKHGDIHRWRKLGHIREVDPSLQIVQPGVQLCPLLLRWLVRSQRREVCGRNDDQAEDDSERHSHTCLATDLSKMTMRTRPDSPGRTPPNDS